MLLELVLRLADYPPAPISGWAVCEVKAECNQLGFRGRPFEEDTPHIILVGDSQVSSYAYSFSEMPERRLEEFLSAAGVSSPVRTLGTPGYGQDQQLLVLKEFLERYRARTVLLWFTAGNDVVDTLFRTSGFNRVPKPTFWLEGDELRGPTEGWRQPVKTRGKLLYLAGHALGFDLEARWEKTLPPPYASLEPVAEEAGTTWQRQWDQGRRAVFMDMAAEKTDKALHLVPRSPRTEYGIRLVRQLIAAMQALSAEQGAGFYVVKDYRPWELSRGAPRVERLNGRDYRVSGEQYARNIEEILAGFPTIEVPLSANPEVSGEDRHLNLGAIDEVMREVARRIGVERRLAPAARPAI